MKRKESKRKAGEKKKKRGRKKETKAKEREKRQEKKSEKKKRKRKTEKTAMHVQSLSLSEGTTRWRHCTFELHVDSVAVAHKVATRQQLRSVGGAGTSRPVHLTNIVSLHTVGVQAQLAARVHMTHVLLTHTRKNIEPQKPTSCKI